ncbi:Uncharacterized protein SCF082_LOCUS29534, partial [Durusdinium trenchii]
HGRSVFELKDCCRSRMPQEPYKEAIIYGGVCDKEFRTWVKNFIEPHVAQRTNDGCSYYRLPSPGDAVTISGLRRRHELNGVRGEVLSSKQDEFGRIRVRIDAEGSRTMKIQPFRLVPDSLAPVCKEFDKVSLRSGCERATNSTAPSAVSGVSNTSSRLERRCLVKAASLPTI